MKDLHARRPLDRTAARVVGRGTHYVADRHPSETCSDLPLPTQPIPHALRVTPSFTDLTGRQVGRLTVVGLAVERAAGRSGAPRGRWVCRCVCGRYCIRRARALKDPAYVAAWCDHCDHQKRIREHGSGYFDDGTPVRDRRVEP